MSLARSRAWYMGLSWTPFALLQVIGENRVSTKTLRVDVMVSIDLLPLIYPIKMTFRNDNNSSYLHLFYFPRPSTSKSSLVTASARGADCDPDDENCEGSAVDPDEDDDDEDDGEDNDDEDVEDKNENINMDYRPDAGRQNQSKNNKTPNTKYQHGASSKTPAAQLGGQTSRVSTQQRHQVHKPHQGSSQTGKGDADWTHRRGSTASTPNPLSAAQSPASNSHNTYLRNSQDVSSSSIKDRHFQQLAINMNIVLIAGIAAGIVVLLFILVVAACKFYASSTAPAGAKALTDYHQQRAANKAAYAYEACNTGGKCSSPLLVPSSQQSLPVLNATSQAGLTTVGSATSTVSKPAKKDVKEWYV